MFFFQYGVHTVVRLREDIMSLANKAETIILSQKSVTYV